MVIKNENLGVKYIKQFYDELKEEFNGSSDIVVDFSKVKRIDLSAVQVLVAAGRKAKLDGKTIKLKSISNDVRNQMIICGIKL